MSGDDACGAGLHRQRAPGALLPRIEARTLVPPTCAAAKGRLARASLNGRLTGPLPTTTARRAHERPLLLLDIDGVVSLFGFAPQAPPPGTWHSIDGIPHFLSATAAAHLRALADVYEPAWCSGWEERANEYLPGLLGLPGPLPFLSFGGADLGRASAEANTGERPEGEASAAGAHTGQRPGSEAGAEANTGERPVGEASAAGVHAGQPPGSEAGGGNGGTARRTRGHWKLAAIDAYAGARAVAWIDDCLDARCHAWAAARTAPTLLVQTDAAVGITASHVRELLRWVASAPCDAPAAPARSPTSGA